MFHYRKHETHDQSSPALWYCDAFRWIYDDNKWLLWGPTGTPTRTREGPQTQDWSLNNPMASQSQCTTADLVEYCSLRQCDTFKRFNLGVTHAVNMVNMHWFIVTGFSFIAPVAPPPIGCALHFMHDTMIPELRIFYSIIALFIYDREHALQEWKHVLKAFIHKTHMKKCVVDRRKLVGTITSWLLEELSLRQPEMFSTPRFPFQVTNEKQRVNF